MDNITLNNRRALLSDSRFNDKYIYNYRDDSQWVRCKLVPGAECQHEGCKGSVNKTTPSDSNETTGQINRLQNKVKYLEDRLNSNSKYRKVREDKY